MISQSLSSEALASCSALASMLSTKLKHVMFEVHIDMSKKIVISMIL